MRGTFLPLLAAISLSLASCLAPRQMREVEKNTATASARIDSLRMELERVKLASRKAELAALRAAETATRLRADMQLQDDQLAEQIRQLSDRLEDVNNRLANLPGKWRLAEKKTAGTAAPPSQSDQSNQAGTDTERSALAEKARLYEMAYQDLVRGQYELSRQGFGEFLRKYPQSALADNAQYWIAESFYAQQKFARAAAEFSQVPIKYPTGDKVPAAKLKRAYALLALGQRADARSLLKQVVNQFPTTPEADLARDKLEEH